MKSGLILGGSAYARLFPSLVTCLNYTERGGNYKSQKALIKAVKDGSYSIVVFTGGTDVNPHLYGEAPEPETGEPDCGRDRVESEIFKAAKDAGVPMLGVCRGAQFLTVMNGGKLRQHISGHAGRSHEVKWKCRGEAIFTLATSTHHQCMLPTFSSKPYVVLGVSTHDGVVEAVYWDDSRCLCIQGHPEYVTRDTQFRQVFEALMKERLNVDV